MDKQKRIEKMARIIAFELCPNRAIHKKWGEEAQCYSDNNFAECEEIKNVVDKLYNAGYRKIPENAVVLTKEEYEKLLDVRTDVILKDIDKVFKEEFEDTKRSVERKIKPIYKAIETRTRKETAEKFASLVEFHSVSTMQDGIEYFTISALGLKEILHEEFGIPYYETCEEITDKVVQNGN